MSFTKRYRLEPFVTQLTLPCREIVILGSNMFKLPRGWVSDLHITGDVFVAVDFIETIECQVGDIGHVKLMVTFYGQQQFSSIKDYSRTDR